MSKDKIEVNMNVYDIPILVEALEEANKEIERLTNIINEFEKYLEETKGIYEEYTCAIKKLKELKGGAKE